MNGRTFSQNPLKRGKTHTTVRNDSSESFVMGSVRNGREISVTESLRHGIGMFLVGSVCHGIGMFIIGSVCHGMGVFIMGGVCHGMGMFIMEHVLQGRECSLWSALWQLSIMGNVCSSPEMFVMGRTRPSWKNVRHEREMLVIENVRHKGYALHGKCLPREGKCSS